mgnify:CR=1 FL=1
MSLETEEPKEKNKSVSRVPVTVLAIAFFFAFISSFLNIGALEVRAAAAALGEAGLFAFPGILVWHYHRSEASWAYWTALIITGFFLLSHQ